MLSCGLPRTKLSESCSGYLTLTASIEALTALTALLHERHPDWDFVCFTEKENEPSRALLKKLGYRDMGYAPRKESEVFGKWLKAETEEEILRAVAVPPERSCE